MCKTFRLLLVFVILLGLLVGCQTNEAELSVFELTLSEQEKEALITAYYNWRESQPGKEAVVEWASFSDLESSEPTYFGYRYYGTFGDCIVWFKGKMSGEPTELSLAGSVFAHPHEADYRVCRNGAYYTLQQAYEQELITEKEVAVVAKRHAEYNAAVVEDPLEHINMTQETKQNILQAYWTYRNLESGNHSTEPTIRSVWRYQDMYAVYIFPSGNDTSISNYDICFLKDSADGSFNGYYRFQYAVSYKGNLYIYKNNSLYTLEEAYDAGILTNAHLDGLVESYQ